MTQQDQETNRKITVSIPGLVEMRKYFDLSQSTGTVSAIPETENLREYLNLNVTGRGQSQLDENLFYYYFQPKAFGGWSTPQAEVYWQKRAQEDVAKEARAIITSIGNRSIAQEANEILDLIQSQLSYYNVDGLPLIRAYELDNGSIALEWIVGHFRVGFNFEVDQKESGYFLISDRTAGEIRSYGYLKGLNKLALVKSLLMLIFGN